MREYLGHSSQLFEVRQSVLSDGRGRSMRVIDIWNGSNLTVTLLPDRCLDMGVVRFQNNNMSFITPSGYVAPAYYSDRNPNGWLRTFGAGFMTTCGLQNIGDPDPTDSDVPQHGRIGNTPASDLMVDKADDGMSVRIRARMEEVVIFGARLGLTREYVFRYGEDTISFTDTITNLGFSRVPVSVLYHFNMGYPLLSELATLVLPSTSVRANSAHAETGIREWNKITTPQHEFSEMCYYHTLSENCFGIDNPSIRTSLRISFESDGMLDHFVQWKMFGEGDYVMGLEPCSSTIEGRSDAIGNGTQKWIEPGQTFTNRLCARFKEID